MKVFLWSETEHLLQIKKYSYLSCFIEGLDLFLKYMRFVKLQKGMRQIFASKRLCVHFKNQNKMRRWKRLTYVILLWNIDIFLVFDVSLSMIFNDEALFIEHKLRFFQRSKTAALVIRSSNLLWHLSNVNIFAEKKAKARKANSIILRYRYRVSRMADGGLL